jgi:hypothetical protein
MRTNGSLLNGLCPLNGKFNPATVKIGNFHEIPEKSGTKWNFVSPSPKLSLRVRANKGIKLCLPMVCPWTCEHQNNLSLWHQLRTRLNLLDKKIPICGWVVWMWKHWRPGLFPCFIGWVERTSTEWKRPWKQSRQKQRSESAQVYDYVLTFEIPHLSNNGLFPFSYIYQFANVGIWIK